MAHGSWRVHPAAPPDVVARALTEQGCADCAFVVVIEPCPGPEHCADAADGDERDTSRPARP